MILFVTVFHIIASISLILIVLLQAGKDSGLVGAFGSGGAAGASDSVFGAQSSSFLNKFTSLMAVLFMSTSLLLALFSARENRSLLLTKKRSLAERAMVQTEPTVSTVKNEKSEEATKNALPDAKVNVAAAVKTNVSTQENMASEKVTAAKVVNVDKKTDVSEPDSKKDDINRVDSLKKLEKEVAQALKEIDEVAVKREVAGNAQEKVAEKVVD
ncbi:preprotein translocase subunit SecG [PVC group bacterium (ex Bugula neritina AB1)]|nr:preprotein translocase subunit SecG [PVC group bacterium (ex Bugula neritina AB1)]